MIDRRRSAPLQLENAEKLESGQVEVRACQIGACQIGAGQVRAGSGQGESDEGESGEVSQVRANQVRASQACVPMTLVAILCVMSPVLRLPMPDIAFRGACFDTSNTCFAE